MHRIKSARRFKSEARSTRDFPTLSGPNDHSCLISQSVSQLFHGPAPRSPLHRLAVRLRHSRSNTSTEYSLPGATQLSPYKSRFPDLKYRRDLSRPLTPGLRHDLPIPDAASRRRASLARTAGRASRRPGARAARAPAASRGFPFPFPWHDTDLFKYKYTLHHNGTRRHAEGLYCGHAPRRLSAEHFVRTIG